MSEMEIYVVIKDLVRISKIEQKICVITLDLAQITTQARLELEMGNESIGKV